MNAEDLAKGHLCIGRSGQRESSPAHDKTRASANRRTFRPPPARTRMQSSAREAALKEENAKLKQELEALRVQLQKSTVATSAQPSAAAAAAATSSHANGAAGPPKANGSAATAAKSASNNENNSDGEEMSSGLRVTPLFTDGQCVEIVARVVKDIRSKPKKKKGRRGAHKAKPKGKNKMKKKKKSKRPVIVGTTDESSVVRPAYDYSLESKDVVNAKHKALDGIKVHTPVAIVNIAEDIRNILINESKKTNFSAFYLVNLGAVVEKHVQWLKYLGRAEPFYAVKANPDINIVRTLAALGAGFDCASKVELDEVLSIGVDPSKIIFANPCKQKEHILFAKEKGVKMMTFDNAAELDKISVLFPGAHVVLRILADDSHSLCQFGTKFGASIEESIKLIAHCRSLNLNLTGVSFHVGSGCGSAYAWVDALKRCKVVFEEAKKFNYNLSLVDLGGGWPGFDDPNGLTFEEIAKELNPALEEIFPHPVRIIAEPGRFYCAASYTLAVTVVSRRERYSTPSNPNLAGPTPVSPPSPIASPSLSPVPSPCPSPAPIDHHQHGSPPRSSSPPLKPVKEILYYLSDGVYGSFNNVIFDHAHPSPFAGARSGTELQFGDKQQEMGTKSCLFGPTCDSIDVICKDIELPELEVGDWLYFPNMGAYTVASASSFNGFKPPNASYIMCMAPIPATKEKIKKNKMKKIASTDNHQKLLAAATAKSPRPTLAVPDAPVL